MISISSPLKKSMMPMAVSYDVAGPRFAIRLAGVIALAHGRRVRRWIGGIRRPLDAGYRPPSTERRAPGTDPPAVIYNSRTDGMVALAGAGVGPGRAGD